MGTWLGDLGLNIYGKFALGIPPLCAHPCSCTCEGSIAVRTLGASPFLWIFLTSAHKITAETKVRSNSRNMRFVGFAQGLSQCHLHAGGRCSAPHEHANWTAAIFAP
jgi:hypothetical protein